VWGPSSEDPHGASLAHSRERPPLFFLQTRGLSCGFTALYAVWRIFRATMDLLRPMGVTLAATWMSGAIIPADPLSRINEEPRIWQEDLRKRCNNLGIPMPHIRDNKLAWSEARRRIGQICCIFKYLPVFWSVLSSSCEDLLEDTLLWLGSIPKTILEDHCDGRDPPYIQHVVCESLLRLFYRTVELVRISPKPNQRLLQFGVLMRLSCL